jgi:uncharacterized protein (TIGR01777 family)
MKTTTLEYESQIPTTTDDLFAWHARPGAFERLTPDWAHTRVIESSGSIYPGDWKKLRVALGPTHFDWDIEHERLEGVGFRDVQRRGPFKSWKHDHHFRASGPGESLLEDRIDYALPFGAIGALVADSRTRRTLDNLFWFRHTRTRNDLARHHRSMASAPLRIAVTGSTGLVGSQLVAFLRTGGHTVLPIVRTRTGALDEIHWNPQAKDIDATRLEGVDAVIHLAGTSIADGRWTQAQKHRIEESRVRGTSLIAETLAKLSRPPNVLVSASAVGFYGDRGEAIITEDTPAGVGFLSDVCAAWETAADPARDAGIRVVHPRLGIVLAGRGGMLSKLLPLFRFGGGGRLSDGSQYMSWIALDDLLGILLESVTNEQLSGPVNAVSPNPVTNREFTAILARVLHRPALFPAPAPFLRVVLGQMADELLLTSQRAVPECLEEVGFRFFFPTVEEALRFELGSIDEETRSRFVEVARSTVN